MQTRIDDLIAKMKLQSGASSEQLCGVELKLGVVFPHEYKNFMLRSNGAEGDIGNSYLALWSIEEIIPLNESYAVNEFAPGLLIFGSDGDGTAYAFDTRSESMPIVAVEFIGMNLNEVVLCGRTFHGFLEFLYNKA